MIKIESWLGIPQVNTWGIFFSYLRSNSNTLTMLIIPIQITAQDCLDCAQHGAEGDWTSAIACIITLAVTALIRNIEKKRIERKHNKKS